MVSVRVGELGQALVPIGVYESSDVTGDVESGLACCMAPGIWRENNIRFNIHLKTLTTTTKSQHFYKFYIMMNERYNAYQIFVYDS